MSKITNDGLTQFGTGYGNSGHQRVKMIMKHDTQFLDLK